MSGNVSRTVLGILGGLMLVCILGTIGGLLLVRFFPGGSMVDALPFTSETPSTTATQTATFVEQSALIQTNTPHAVSTQTATIAPTLDPPTQTATLPIINTDTPPVVEQTSETVDQESVQQARVFLVDDFSDRELDWATATIGDSYIDYHEGGVFAIAISEPEFVGFSYPQVDYPFALSDVVVSISANVVDGSGYWGIRCRYADEGNFYMVAVRDGEYMISKNVDGERIVLTDPEWIENEYLNLDLYDDYFVPITVSCIGNTIELEATGYGIVDSIVDDSQLVGFYDIFARSGNTPGEWEGYYLKVLYDNFGMYVP